MRENLIDLYVKSFDLSEEERDHGLGAVATTYGERWFSDFIGEVVSALGSVMTEDEKTAAFERLW